MNRAVPVFAFLFAVGSLAATGFAQPVVSLGTIELDGGTESQTLDAAAFVGSGGPNSIVSGTLKNRLGVTITDVTVSLRKKGTTGSPPTAGDVTVGNQSNDTGATADGQGQTATVTGLGILSGGTASVSVDEINTADIGSDLVVSITPSFPDKPKGSGFESNSMDGYAFTLTSDARRNGVEDMVYDRCVALVENRDQVHDVVGLSGTLALPAGATQELEAVYLQDVDDDFEPVPNANVSITSDTSFTVTGFDALEYGERYELVLVFSEAFSGETVRMLLEASY